jgi:hypothetical protein
VHAVVRGMVAGALASVPMSAVTLAAQRAEVIEEQPAESLVRFAGRVTGQHPPRPVVEAMAAVSHAAVGAGLGAAYALLPRVGPPRLRGAALGMAFGAAAYESWIPALGVLPAGSAGRPARQGALVLAHAVFGAALGTLDERLAHRGW